jgi:protein TonB
MFSDSLLEAGHGPQSHRCVATCVSFSVQAIGVSLLLAMSLMYTVVLPPVRVADPPFTVSAADLSAITLVNTTGLTPPSQSSQAIIYDNTPHGRFIRPSNGPSGNHPSEDTGADVGPGAPWSIIGVGDRNGSREMAPILNLAPVMPDHSTEPAKRPDMSTIMESLLIHRVEPEYPILAERTRTQGEVVLRAVISKEGTVEELHVVSGHPMLAAAAMRAVNEWRYRPCLLNGKPIEVEAQIIVRFTLAE